MAAKRTVIAALPFRRRLAMAGTAFGPAAGGLNRPDPRHRSCLPALLSAPDGAWRGAAPDIFHTCHPFRVQPKPNPKGDRIATPMLTARE
ncbi:hypothetical protein SLH49_08295 [Cognatiyoonia sp. IB215446]|uniref:hypothetical protein n=1 Tax=Cognatiyoonia sp. IB215446 TaxID=3097355 RepID=UPI002A173FE2|nr:hypothetical protein [Cognatiyoonia sp. IB215446]MDX8347984.1 hypothetical protein [Cognatiyoonia sp. IB215446]